VGDRNRALGGEQFEYRRCRRCETVFIARLPLDLDRYYAAEGYGSAVEDASPTVARREAAKLDLLSRFVSTGHMIEIGPGPGYFAARASAAGFDVSAIEMDAGYAQQLSERHGIRVIRSDAPQDAIRALPAADCVVLWHAIEHLPEPRTVLRECARTIRRGGVLLIATPNPQSLQFRLLGRYWLHLDAPRHLQLIPAGALRSCLEQVGARHVLTTTTDALGLELNRMGWEAALRWHPARRWSSRVSLGGSAAIVKLVSVLEARDLAGAAYTSVFICD
jgi:2-polyprenyl-3-methyl-5-hydroxy-6-metoxy-1,4-benzoquinol methylase